MENIFREGVKVQVRKAFLHMVPGRSEASAKQRFWTKFLNQEAAFFEGVEKMSRKLNLAISIYGYAKSKRGHYEDDSKSCLTMLLKREKMK